MSDQHSSVKAAPRLLVFDSGLGGLTVTRALRESAPEAMIAYVADDAGFPYGALDEATLRARVLAVVGDAVRAMRPDAAVIACNTASTMALAELRAAYSLPFVGTVPAIKPAAAISRTRLVSVLATPATVSREYTRALIAEHGQGCAFTLVGSNKLAAIAERVMAGDSLPDASIAEEIAPCFIREGERRTDVVVLACTHYPLLIDRLERLAPWPVTWLDPAPAIARRTANILAQEGFVVGVGAQRPRGEFYFTSGEVPPAPVLALLEGCGFGLGRALAGRGTSAPSLDWPLEVWPSHSWKEA